MKSVSYGFCYCGCGLRTPLAHETRRDRGHIAGEPLRYLTGHHTRQPRQSIRYGKIGGADVVYIPLTQGKWAIVDRDKLHLVRAGVWFYSDGYACQYRNGRVVRMQNVLMPPPKGKITDHRFGNRLDNRVSQLQRGTVEDNHKNQGKQKNNTSGYKGVIWPTARDRCSAQIMVNGKTIRLGSFPKDKVIEAAKAYDRAAIKYYGKFARLNFPKDR